MKVAIAVIALALSAAAAAFAAPPAGDERMRRAVSDSGCTLCHREASTPRGPDDATPLAPAWREIAARYRGRPDAEATLTRVVLDGADPAERHWKNRMEFNAMRSNAPRLDAAAARAVVRWILSLP